MNATLVSVDPGTLTHTTHDQGPLIKRKPLAHILNVAGIKVFDPESVGAYKTAFRKNFCERKARSEASTKQSDVFLEPTKIWTMVFMALIAIGCLSEGLLWIGVAVSIGFLGTILIFRRESQLLAKTVFEFELARLDAKTDITWRRRSFFELLDDTSPLVVAIGPAPKEVLEIQEEISLRCPEARFSVHVFDQDPFLSVNLGDEEYYVAVWGEDGFKRA
jgi:hypothetical protein